MSVSKTLRYHRKKATDNPTIIAPDPVKRAATFVLGFVSALGEGVGVCELSVDNWDEGVADSSCPKTSPDGFGDGVGDFIEIGVGLGDLGVDVDGEGELLLGEDDGEGVGVGDALGMLMLTATAPLFASDASVPPEFVYLLILNLYDPCESYWEIVGLAVLA